MNSERHGSARGRGPGSIGAEFGVMAGSAEIRVVGLAPEAAQQAIAAAIAECRRIESTYSRYRADSIVSRINAAAGSGVAIAVDAETAGLLDFAAQLYEQSEGLFDITSGVLRRAWNFREPRLPRQSEIDALLDAVGWQHVDWFSPHAGGDSHIRLRKPGMEIDFGGFGKEYAADRAAAILLQAGARGGYVNLGGDIRVLGADDNGAPWRFGIQHPRQPDEVATVISLTAGALATSGDYERYFEIDGRRYSHLLDPQTGWPVSYWQSVSVIAPVCIAAGALSTVAMLKAADAIAFLDAQQMPYLLIDDQGRLRPADIALG